MESEVRSRFRPSLGGPPAHPPLHESVMNLSLFKTLLFSIDGLHSVSGTRTCDFSNNLWHPR